MKIQMSDKRRTSLLLPVVLVLLALVGAGLTSLTADAAQRSINEFIAAQQSQDGWAFLWSDLEGKTVYMDYANLAYTTQGLDLGTTMTGTVNERPLPDGRAEVSVVLHTRNAQTEAHNSSQPLFGYSWADIAADPSVPVALGECEMQVTFINTAPGAPLPHIVFLDPAQGQELLRITFKGSASGVLREGFGPLAGTPGRLEVTQVGLIRVYNIANPNSRVGLDAFPAEHITIQPVGK